MCFDMPLFSILSPHRNALPTRFLSLFPRGSVHCSNMPCPCHVHSVMAELASCRACLLTLVLVQYSQQLSHRGLGTNLSDKIEDPQDLGWSPGPRQTKLHQVCAACCARPNNVQRPGGQVWWTRHFAGHGTGEPPFARPTTDGGRGYWPSRPDVGGATG